MALSAWEEKRIRELLEEESSYRRRAALETRGSFMSWLKNTARWLWDKITDGIIGALFSWLLSVFL